VQALEKVVASFETLQKRYTYTHQHRCQRDLDTSKKTDVHVQALEKVVATFETLQKRYTSPHQQRCKRDRDASKEIY